MIPLLPLALLDLPTRDRRFAFGFFKVTKLRSGLVTMIFVLTNFMNLMPYPNLAAS
jgi:hypothetical protein